MFTITIFALVIAVVLAGLIAGLDYFSAPKGVQKKIRNDFRRTGRWLTGQGPTGLGGPFEDLSETTGQENFGDEIVAGSIKSRPATRRIVGWLGGGQVVAISPHGEEFVGQIVRRSLTWRRYNGGWVLVRNPDSHWACWCQLPAPV